MTSPDGAEQGAGPAGRTLRRWLPAAVIVLLMLVALQQGWHRFFSLEQLAIHEQALRRAVSSHYLFSIALYAAIYVVSIALSLPGGLILTIAGGFLFGWLAGGIVALLSATLGATLIFLIAKTSIGEWLVGKGGRALTAMRKGFQRDALNYLLFLRLVPAFPFWLVNLAPALLGVPLSTFVIGTFVGIIPGTFVSAFFGSSLEGALAPQLAKYQGCRREAVTAGADTGACEVDIDAMGLLTPGLVLALVALALIALAPVVVKKVMARRGRAHG